MIPKKILFLGIAPLFWGLCSNYQSAEVHRQIEQSRCSYTRNLINQRLSTLRHFAYDSSCQTQMTLEPLLDAWGRMIRCSHEGMKVSLISAGPDREFNSADDIELSRDQRTLLSKEN